MRQYKKYTSVRGFPKMVVPQNGWFLIFIMENPIKMEDLGAPPFTETPVHTSVENPNYLDPNQYSIRLPSLATYFRRRHKTNLQSWELCSCTQCLPPRNKALLRDFWRIIVVNNPLTRPHYFLAETVALGEWGSLDSHDWPANRAFWYLCQFLPNSKQRTRRSQMKNSFSAIVSCGLSQATKRTETFHEILVG